MAFDDDDLEGSSLSTRKALERADHGKSEKKEKIQRKKDLLRLKQQVLKEKVQQEHQQKKEQAVQGTKTLQEELEQEIESAGKDDTSETLVKKGTQEEAERKQADYEEEQQLP